MKRSIEIWVSRAVRTITPGIALWAESYPLPIGVAAARRLYAESGRDYPDELTELLPFRGAQEAYWGLRVTADYSGVDMFGLKWVDVFEPLRPKGWTPSGEERLRLGSFAYSLRGLDDTSLLGLVESGAAWWRDFSADRVLGRPTGSGTWPSPDEFESDLRAAVADLYARGQTPTQEKAATLLHCSHDTVKRWLKRIKPSWREIKESSGSSIGVL